MKNSPKYKIDAAIFDFDGTLGDTMRIWDAAPKLLIERHGGTAPDDIAAQLSPLTMDESIKWIIARFAPDMDAAALRAELYEILWAQYKGVTELKPGVKDALFSLKAQGLRMCVLSATDANMIDDTLRRLGVRGLFDFVALSDDWGGKTDPECFMRAARLLNAAPERCAVFEDALHAARAAKAAGFYVAGVYDYSGDAGWPELKRIADWSGEYMSEWKRV